MGVWVVWVLRREVRRGGVCGVIRLWGIGSLDGVGKWG